VQEQHATQKSATALKSGVGIVEALAEKHGVSLEVAGAIFAAGEASGEANGRGSRSSINGIAAESSSVCEPTGFSFVAGQRVTLEQLRNEQALFAQERDWDQFHTPRNLALALVGEVGELCEIFQWKVQSAYLNYVYLQSPKH
jgi:hypothetical protein